MYLYLFAFCTGTEYLVSLINYKVNISPGYQLDIFTSNVVYMYKSTYLQEP